MNINSFTVSMPGMREELADLLKNFSRASTIALSVVFSVFAGIYVGHYLDNKVFDGEYAPWLTFVFFLFGLGGGIKNFFMLQKRFEKELEEESKRQ